MVCTQGEVLKKSALPRGLIYLLVLLTICASTAFGGEATNLGEILDNLGTANMDELYQAAYSDVNYPGLMEYGLRYMFYASDHSLPYYKTFRGCFYTFSDNTELAVLSDDGCNVYIDGFTVHSLLDNVQELSDYINWMTAIPCYFLGENIYYITVVYSSVYGLGLYDIEGVTLYAFNGGGIALDVNIHLDSNNDGSITSLDEPIEENEPGFCIRKSSTTLYPANITIDSQLLVPGFCYRFDIPDSLGVPSSVGWFNIYRDAQGTQPISPSVYYDISTLPSTVYIQHLGPGSGTLELAIRDYNGRELSRDVARICVGGIIRVKPSGNDSNNGTSWALAKKTITDAIDAAQPGDEIWVAAGDYFESFTMKAGVALYGGFAGNETSLSQRNWTKNTTSIMPGDQNSVIGPSVKSTVTTVFDGFNIKGASTALDLSNLNTSATISHNIIKNNASGISGSCSNIRSVNINIVDNWITDNILGGVAWTSSNALNGVKIANNTITYNHTEDNSGGYGISINGNNISIANNIIYSNYSGISITNTSANCVIRNCVYNNTAGDYINFTPTSGYGNFSSNPQLAGIHLLSTSPCKNASVNYAVGNTYISTGDTDIDGQQRNSDGIVDIGADESYGCDLYTLTLKASTFWILPNTSVTVTATVKNLSGQGVSNCPVTFTTTQGHFANNQTSYTAYTNSSGDATATLTITTCPTTANVTATAYPSSCGSGLTANTVVKTVCDQPTTPCEIFFCLDCTGSMNSTALGRFAHQTPPSVVRFLNEMQSAGVTFRLGGMKFNDGTFMEYNDALNMGQLQSMNNFTTVSSFISSWVNNGYSPNGGDLHELQLDALDVAVQDMNAYSTPGNPNRYIVLITDFGYHENDWATDLTKSYVMNELTNSGCKVYISLFEATYGDTYEGLNVDGEFDPTNDWAAPMDEKYPLAKLRAKIMANWPSD